MGAPFRSKHSLSAMIGTAVVLLLSVACFVSLPWALSPRSGETTPRYRAEAMEHHRLPPPWAPHAPDERARRHAPAPVTPGSPAATAADYPLGSDLLGRDLLTRCLMGGAVSLGVGLAAAAISVLIGTLYGAVSAYAGGRIDAVMMRIVDVLYGLPYILLVILLALAADAVAESRLREAVLSVTAERAAFVEQSVADGVMSPADAGVEAARRFPMPAEGARSVINIVTLLAAIGGVSWLTMARVIRGQVLSLKAQPFVEAARAVGASPVRIFLRHLLPNLVGPIVVYATLTVPQAILQESFLSFLGIGVAPPVPSWGNLVADGLSQLNPVRSRWWLLLFPSMLLAATLLALNLLGEALRDSLDPRRARSGRVV